MEKIAILYYSYQFIFQTVITTTAIKYTHKISDFLENVLISFNQTQKKNQTRLHLYGNQKYICTQILFSYY